MMSEEVLIEAIGLKKYFKDMGSFMPGASAPVTKAIDDVSFKIKRGEVLGLVGESGCGKSTLGLSILRLHESNAGQLFYEGTDIFKLGRESMREHRKDMQIVFQDPYSSLNPRMTVNQIVKEPLINFKMGDKEWKTARVEELLELVGLDPGTKGRYPHEFSGGQRQRIGIARALASGPRFIVCDESVSALDVSIQAQILNLLVDLKQRLGLTYLFISHDLMVVNHLASRIAVMYLGKLVEIADRDELFSNPFHPYTQALLSCVPIPDPEIEEKRERIILSGDIPSPMNPPSGCHFHPRCRLSENVCEVEYPSLRKFSETRFVACHLA
jgi:oligopeptide transport system ATP-binding protein